MLCGNAATSRPVHIHQAAILSRKSRSCGDTQERTLVGIAGYMTVLCDDIGASVVLMANEAHARHYLPQSC